MFHIPYDPKNLEILRKPPIQRKISFFATPSIHRTYLALDRPDDLLSHFAVREAQGLRPGGFGLLLAKNLVDELIYSQQGNEVLLVKYVDPPLSQADSDNVRDPKPLRSRE